MLLRYVVSNYKSIGHPIEFSMLPQNNDIGIANKHYNSIPTKKGYWNVLRRSGFFGPNASGKSSFIESVQFAKNYILTSQKTGKGTGVKQSKGYFKDLEGLSTFQFTFSVGDHVYDYGFSMNTQQVCEEWLYKLYKDDFKMLFSRETDEKGITSIKTTDYLAKSKSIDRSLADLLKFTIREGQRNQLFLNKLYENGVEAVEQVVMWFKNLQIIFPNSKITALPIAIKQDERLRDFVGEMLKKMSTGIFEVEASKDRIDLNEFAENNRLPEELIDKINEQKHGILTWKGDCFIFSDEDKDGIIVIHLKFKHKINGKNIRFDMEDESDGTQRLLDLIPILFTLGKSEAIYFVDEIDRSLHTKLVQFLLSGFLSTSCMMRNQIIFTAHDVNIINMKKFIKDEIWFVEKNALGESKIRPLSDFDINDEQDTLKSYLNGRFGAIPVIDGGFCDE